MIHSHMAQFQFFMLHQLFIFTLPALIACGSTAPQQEDTSSLTVSEDSGSIEPSSDTQEPSTDTYDSGDTHNPSGPPFSISSISPQYGPTIGGSEIYIYGADFPEELRVFIGMQEAEVLNCSDTKITIRTPSIDSAELLDVQVQSQEGTVSHTQSFQYYDTAQGEAGIIGRFDVQQQLGAYWSESDASLDAKLMFITPQDIHWWNLKTSAMDSCTHIDDLPSLSLYPLDISAPFLELHTSEGSLALVWDSFYQLYEEDSNSTLIPENTTFSLNIEEGPLAGLSFPSFFHSSESMDLIFPILDTEQPAILARGQEFLWEPSGATWISLRLARLDSMTGQYSEQIYCTLNDDGVHILDPTLWKEWEPQQQIDVYFSRAIESTNIAPYNLSQARIVGSHTIVGAGFSGD